jgi:parallel beta-helix repeat protein
LRLPLGLRTIIEMKLRALADFSYIVFGVALALAFPFSKAEAQRTIQVPGDAPTVQAGINMANTGDTVSIAPGTYSGPINFNGKAITVSGSAPGVILDGGRKNGPVVSFSTGETRNSILENVTVQNGVATSSMDAGGIYVYETSPIIRDSVVQNNQGCGFGIYNGAPLISGNIITGNAMAQYSGCVPPSLAYPTFLGGGILVFGLPTGTPNTEITGNTIEGNTAVWGGGGISAWDAGRPLIENNTLTQNLTNDRGAGIMVGGNTSPAIIQNLIYDNTINPILAFPSYGDVGAGLNIGPADESMHSFKSAIVNNTFVGNKVLNVSGARQSGTQVFASGFYDNVQFFNNLIIGTDAQTPVDCDAMPVSPVSPPTFDHNDVSNLGLGPAIYSGSCTDQTGQNGNISADPNFAANTSSQYPYQLQLPSPAIDTGNNNAPDLPQLDFLGQPRIQDATGLSSGIVDMGVYEFPGKPAPVPPPPSFTLTVNPASATLEQGQSGTFSVTVTPTAANLGSVLLTCSGLPAASSCTFTSATMSFTSASPQSSTLTVSIGTAQSSLLRVPSHKDDLSIALAGLFFIPVLLAGKRGSSNRRFPGMLRIASICVISSCVGLSGCGPDKYIIIGAPQTYQLTVQASAVNSGLSKQASVALVINQY